MAWQAVPASDVPFSAINLVPLLMNICMESFPLNAITAVTNEVVCKYVCLHLDVIAMCMESDYITIDGDLRHVFARTTAVSLHLNYENADSTMLRWWYVSSMVLAVFLPGPRQ